MSRRLARWRPDAQEADRRLEEIANDALKALHETVGADRSAFGLYEAACVAGERLAGVMSELAQEAPESADAFTAFLAREVGGEGGTLADAAIRRAAVKASRDVLLNHPEVSQSLAAGATGRGLTWDFLCDLYQLFFADTVAEFLRSVIAAHIQLAVPALMMVDPAGQVADWISHKLLKLVPSPCEEAAEAQELAEAAETADSVLDMADDPVGALPAIAHRLVPGAVGRVLGLVTEEMIGKGEDAA